MAFGDRTWLLDGGGAPDSDCTPAANQNKPAVNAEDQQGSALIGAVVPVTGAVWTPLLSWTTSAIGLLDWPLGQYMASIRVTEIPTGTFAGRIVMRKVSSSCTNLGAVVDTGLFTATGTHLYDESLNPAAGDADERLQFWVETVLFAGGSGRLEVDTQHADTFLRAPLQPGQTIYNIPRRAAAVPLLRR